MDDLFQVSAQAREGVTVVTAAGEVDVSTAPELRAMLQDASEGAIVVDLSQVTFLDSTGLGVLVAASKRGDVRLVVTRPQITKVLEVTGLSEVFSVFSTVEEAIAK